MVYIQSLGGDVDSQFWKEMQDVVKTCSQHTGDGNRDKWLRIMSYDLNLAIEHVMDSGSKGVPVVPVKKEVPQISNVPEALSKDLAAKESQGIEELLANDKLLKQRVTDIKKEGPKAFGQALDLIKACCEHLNNNRPKVGSDAPFVKKYSPILLELLEEIVNWDEQNNLISTLQNAGILNSLALTLGSLDSVYDQLLNDNKYTNILHFMSKLHVSLSKNENLLSTETLSTWLKGVLCLYAKGCYITITPHLEAAQNLNNMLRNTIRKYESNPRYGEIFQSLHNELSNALKSYREAINAYKSKENAETEQYDEKKGILD